VSQLFEHRRLQPIESHRFSRIKIDTKASGNQESARARLRFVRPP
jgi:hypothetical protein